MSVITAKLAGFKEALQNAISGLREAWQTEPVVVLTTAASVITFVAAKLGIVVDERSLLQALEFIVPILVTGFLARRKTVPAVKVVSRKP